MPEPKIFTDVLLEPFNAGKATSGYSPIFLFFQQPTAKLLTQCGDRSLRSVKIQAQQAIACKVRLGSNQRLNLKKKTAIPISSTDGRYEWNKGSVKNRPPR